MSQLRSFAEINAEKAENLPAFSGIKLLHIRNNVKEILSLIGRGDIFDQYTKHDISHIDQMLDILEWLIPNESKSRLTYADWMMLVLATYFHDLGMLVTKNEYLNRNNNIDFISYKEKVENGEFGLEFYEKVKVLGEGSDRFIYQEFVRSNHAMRIKNWLCGYSSVDECVSITKEISRLLDNLDSMFRRDLAKICESHHLDDLDDFTKYKTCARYGNDDNEAVNLHYISIILRTADLLHITSDRTPSIQYRLVNPSDPKSIIEWKKQMAVKAIKPKMKLNEDGNIDALLQQDTIEVTAYFDKPDQAEAFFGLISYLMYAKKEIKQSYDLVQKAIKIQGTNNYIFPWKDIDDSNIETLGFERKLLQFNLDQNNILRLLVGHTLYNDSSVVLRELVQNSLDAIRLQNQVETDEKKTLTEGKVLVKWNTNERTLSILDNGTGMSINDIENYLLKVGSSKYRSEEFVKRYPAFNAISRFGIGILTCFLIANDIDIITNSLDEETANMISLRRVDGKYLLKKLKKNILKSKIQKHGTEIILFVRSDVDMTELENNLKKWIMFPRVDMILQIDDSSTIKIGYLSPREAIEEFIKKYEIDNKQIKVVQDELDGVTIAYPLRYSSFLKEWNFISPNELKKYNEDMKPIGTCIEGIMVEMNTPGYTTDNILAVVNVTGNTKAKTNVARSAIEVNEEKRYLLEKIYKLYSKHIQIQIQDLVKEGYSLAWATEESKYLISPLLPSSLKDEDYEFGEDINIEPQDVDLLYCALNDIKSIIIEKEGKREALSPNDIIKINEVYIVDSKMIRSAESLLREMETNTTLCNLINTISDDCDNKFINMNNIICNFNKYNILHRNALNGKQVVQIDVLKKQRRINLKYENNIYNWQKFIFKSNRALDNTLHIPLSNFKINGLSNEIGVKTIDGIYMTSDHEFTQYLISVISHFNYKYNRDDNFSLNLLLSCVFNPTALNFASNELNSRKNSIDDIFYNYILRDSGTRYSFENSIWNRVDENEFMTMLFKDKYYIYDLSDWSRSNEG